MRRLMRKSWGMLCLEDRSEDQSTLTYDCLFDKLLVKINKYSSTSSLLNENG